LIISQISLKATATADVSGSDSGFYDISLLLNNQKSEEIMGNTASSIQQQQQSSSSSTAAVPPAGCPMHKQEEAASSTGESSVLSQLNPLNNIPALAQSPTSASQKTLLSLERTTSSIPRVRSDSSSSGSACPVAHGDKGKGKAAATAEEEDANWVYPSPQQFYNALARKGKEAPEESIDTMVNIHNWLNEKAWDEVKRWEDRRDPNVKIELAKFEGKPDVLSPKARFHLFLGSLFPNTYK
jgi:cytochrome c heme-lyase